MPTTADQYLASFNPNEQARIRASWEGNPNGLQDWFSNARNAGAVPGNIPDASILQGTGASGYNPADVTAYRSLDPSILAGMTPEQRAVWSMENIDDLSAHGDRQRAYAQWMAWQDSFDPSCPPSAPYRAEDGSGCVEKPDNSNRGYQAGAGGGGGAGGSYSSSSSWNGGGGGTAGNLPAFNAPRFTPPTFEDALNDPGYKFSLDQGVDALQRSAAARGVLRTGGTLKDIIGYGQDRAAQQYGDVFNRALQTFGTQYTGAKDEFAPRYGGWTTMYGGDLSRYLQAQQDALSRWSTQYGGDLSKYLQRENNIYGLINQPPPSPPVWS